MATNLEIQDPRTADPYNIAGKHEVSVKIR